MNPLPLQFLYHSSSSTTSSREQRLTSRERRITFERKSIDLRLAPDYLRCKIQPRCAFQKSQQFDLRRCARYSPAARFTRFSNTSSFDRLSTFFRGLKQTSGFCRRRTRNIRILTKCLDEFASAVSTAVFASRTERERNSITGCDDSNHTLTARRELSMTPDQLRQTSAHALELSHRNPTEWQSNATTISRLNTAPPSARSLPLKHVVTEGREENGCPIPPDGEIDLYITPTTA